MRQGAIQKATKAGSLLLATLAGAMLLVLAACGDANGGEEKATLVFADLDWPSAQIQNAIARRIIEDGYGYPTEAVFGGTVPLMNALAAGDLNINMEIWLPNQQAAYDEAVSAGTIIPVGNSLEDNWQSAFVIPKYVADENPGLRTVHDLPDHAELFVTPDSRGKARLLTCIPGWECEEVNEQKVEAYGLSDYVELINPGSDAALAAEIVSAFERREPILFYYWGPTVLSHQLETEYGGYYLLEEPPYSDECFEADKACAYPVAEVLIVVRNELMEQAPDVIEFLEKWDFNAGNQLAAEGYMGESGADYPQVAQWFLANTDEWKQWVPADVAERVQANLN